MADNGRQAARSAGASDPNQPTDATRQNAKRAAAQQFIRLGFRAIVDRQRMPRR